MMVGQGFSFILDGNVFKIVIWDTELYLRIAAVKYLVDGFGFAVDRKDVAFGKGFGRCR
jgi:hypothetical protein